MSPSAPTTEQRPTEQQHRLTPPISWQILVRGVAAFLRVLFGWRYRMTVSGDVPPAGSPLVVAVNHTGRLEPFLQAYCVWRRTGHWVQPLAKSELFDIPVLAFLGRRAGGIPVYRESTEGRGNAYADAIECLHSGGSVYIAPEGTITHDGDLLPLRQGAARLALQAGVPVLVSTSFGGQRAFSYVVKRPDRNVLFDVHMELLEPIEGETVEELTGRIAATMLDRSRKLREAHPDQDHDAVWWPPYKEPAEPSRTGAENIAKYRASMAEAVHAARERMAAAAAELDPDSPVRTAAGRAREVAQLARARAHEVGERLRHQAEEFSELARRNELGEQVRHRAEELAQKSRELAEHITSSNAHDDTVDDEVPAGADDAVAVEPVATPETDPAA